MTGFNPSHSVDSVPVAAPETSRQVTLFTATCLVIANMIGIGVFTSLGFQVAGIQSGFSLLFLWLAGGVYALCGALAYGELGASMPRSGGEYHFLSQIYHPVIGFLSGWVSVTVGFAAPIALMAIALGTYFAKVFPTADPTIIGLAVVLLVTLIHSQNLKLGSSFQQIFTLLKVLLIVFLVVAGFALGTGQEINFAPTSADLSQIMSAPFAISLVYVTYSYSGWNSAVYLASEVKSPEKNLPRSLLLGTAIVMVLYLLINFIFLYTTPIDLMAGKLEVGYIAADQIFKGNPILGFPGAELMALFISLGLISSISSMVWAGPRVTQSIGEDIPFFKILAKKNRSGVPYYALLLQLAIVIALVIMKQFETVLTYLEFTLILSSFLTVLGVFVSRFRFPDLPRPYKTWGYPITPLIFLAMSVWVLVFLLQQKPMESLAGLGTILLGLPLYFIASKQKLA